MANEAITTPFTFEPLPDGYIRLINILQGGDVPRCEMRHVQFTKELVYDAVSYSWGRGEKCCRIICNGSTMPVTRTVRDAINNFNLRTPDTYARSVQEVLDKKFPPGYSRPFWIDLLCINQDDDVEKSKQVAYMRYIYQRAKIVLVWFGQGDANAEAAIDMLQSLGRGLKRIAQPFLANWGSVEEDEFTSRGLPPPNSSIWAGVRALYHNPWFTRLWVAEESALADWMLLCYGRRHTYWASFAFLGEQLTRLRLDYGYKGSCTRTVAALRADTITQSHTVTSLFELSRDRAATKAVDKLYAIRALLPDHIQDLVVVDYSLPNRVEPWRAYLGFAKKFILVDKELELLAVAPSEHRPAGLPTWCPNLDSPAKQTANLTQWSSTKKSSRETYGIYWAGINLNRPRLPEVELVPSSTLLRIKGFRVDVVEQVASLRDNAPDEKLWHDECFQIAQAALDTTEPAPIALIQTLCAGAAAIGPDFSTQSAQTLRQTYLNFMRYLTERQKGPGFSKDLWLNADELDDQRTAVYYYKNNVACWEGHRFFSTTGGRIGLGPHDIRKGDEICAFIGGRPLYVLRFEGGEKEASFIGDAFVHWLMYYDAIPAEKKGKEEWFILK